jgi:hypothetical protein
LSRGELLKASLLEPTEEFLEHINLDDIEPFTLLILDYYSPRETIVERLFAKKVVLV